MINPALRSRLPYDTLNDFVPGTIVAEAPNMLMVLLVTPDLRMAAESSPLGAKVSAKMLRDLVEWAKVVRESGGKRD